MALAQREPYASKESGSGSTYYQYPLNLGQNVRGTGQHWIEFKAFDFKKKDQLNWACALYNPGGALSTSFKASWEGDKVGMIGGMADKALSLMKRGGTQVGPPGQSGAGNKPLDGARLLELVKAQTGATGSEAATVGLIKTAGRVGMMVEGTKTVMERDQGAVINPYIVAAYKGPENLRSHDFSFKMMPENSSESHNCMHIARLFKAAMLPSHDGGDSLSAPSMLFGYPDQFTIDFAINGSTLKKQNSLFRIGKSVLTAVDLNFDTESLPLFFEGTQNPVTIDMNLSFMEVEIMYREKVINEGF